MNVTKNQMEVTKNSYKDEGEGIVSFPNGLCISDNNVQRNGTRYDIDSLLLPLPNGEDRGKHRR